MSTAKILRVYLDPEPLDRARSGKFNFVNKISESLENRGFRVEFRKNSHIERLRSAARQGYSLFLMDDPLHPNALTMRRSYFYPFWRIEASAKRWEFEVARKPFDPESIDLKVATEWADRWRKWLFKGSAENTTRDGPIYVPLQGRLLHQRSFQSASPIEMLEKTVTNFEGIPVVVGLHPSETYTPAERQALAELGERFQTLRVVEGQMEQALKECRFVVSQNSSAALFGYFFHKPAVLFSRIDFHHIASNVHEIGVQRALDEVQCVAPDFDRYLYWFTVKNAIRADADNVESQILTTLNRRGWQVD